MVLVFGTSSLNGVIHNSLPNFDVGLTSNDPARCHVKLLHLIKLMFSWPGAHELSLLSATDPGYLKAKQTVLLFYLQTSYQFFDHYPTVLYVPQRL